MAAAVVVMSFVALVAFGIAMAVIYLLKVRQLRRDRIPGAKIRMSGRGILSLVLLVSIIWACTCGALALGVYADVRSYWAGLAIVLVVAVLRPIYLAKGGSPFVVTQAERVPEPLEPPVS
ncbi:hypothetical protein BN1051_00107 [Arthrobacter saudimassiliensis]|uniref:Uncharacterized protein n=1 Tax=Arthrobacter saudimassiliensis TaxID=1461584 RepID=A0A078MKF9_9MICC|nr:hypothetical protein BN1051_00107 [Arthrobacter saudimassiliensis]